MQTPDPLPTVAALGDAPDPVVVQQQLLQARQAREAVQLDDGVVRQVEAVELVLWVCWGVGWMGCAPWRPGGHTGGGGVGQMVQRGRVCMQVQARTHACVHARARAGTHTNSLTSVTPRFSMVDILCPAARGHVGQGV